jgi:hypothetical protein
MFLETGNRKLETLIALLVLLSALAPAQSQATPKVSTDPGIVIVTFVLPNGAIYVNLPEDMAPGDTLSGSESINPQGATEVERAQNLAELSKYQLEVAGQRAKLGSFGFTLPKLSDTSGLLPVSVVLKDAAGRELGKAEVPTRPVMVVVGENVFYLPSMGQEGWPVVIVGAFDGNSDNTELEIGGKPQRKLAESPRQATFDSPPGHGSNEMVLKERGIETKGTYRNASVKLSAPKTALMKGEHTIVEVKVEGLDGISSPVLLRLTSAGTVKMEGGNEQTRIILPSQVEQDGTFNLHRTITAEAAGGFNVSGKVQMLGVCLQDDDNGNALLFSPDGGNYYFCPKKGDRISSGGTVRREQCSITFEDKTGERHLLAHVDSCGNKGEASMQLLGKDPLLIKDKDIRNSTCGQCR